MTRHDAIVKSRRMFGRLGRTWVDSDTRPLKPVYQVGFLDLETGEFKPQGTGTDWETAFHDACMKVQNAALLQVAVNSGNNHSCC